jgi:hypothetical protein
MPHWSVKDPAPQAIRCRQPSPLRSRQSSGFLKEPDLVIELLAELAGGGVANVVGISGAVSGTMKLSDQAGRSTS